MFNKAGAPNVDNQDNVDNFKKLYFQRFKRRATAPNVDTFFSIFTK